MAETRKWLSRIGNGSDSQAKDSTFLANGTAAFLLMIGPTALSYQNERYRLRPRARFQAAPFNENPASPGTGEAGLSGRCVIIRQPLPRFTTQ